MLPKQLGSIGPFNCPSCGGSMGMGSRTTWGKCLVCVRTPPPAKTAKQDLAKRRLRKASRKTPEVPENES